MLKKYVKGKVAVFIDASNVYYSMKSLGWSIDFRKLSNYLATVNPIFINYYVAVKNPTEQKELDELVKLGYTLKTKPLKKIRRSHKGRRSVTWKGNLDIELAYDLLISESQYNTCILFSGDSDFEILLRHLKNRNISTVIVSTTAHISYELLQACDHYINLANLKDKVSKKHASPGR